MQSILGLDPGSTHTGWSLISAADRRTVLITQGVIRRFQPHQWKALLRQFNPDIVAIEIAHASRKQLRRCAHLERYARIKRTQEQARMARNLALNMGLTVIDIPGWAASDTRMPATWQQALTGTRYPNAQEVYQELYDLLNHPSIGSVHEMDAIGVAVSAAHDLHLVPIHYTTPYTVHSGALDA